MSIFLSSLLEKLRTTLHPFHPRHAESRSRSRRNASALRQAAAAALLPPLPTFESLELRQLFAATLLITDTSLPANDNTVALTTALGTTSMAQTFTLKNTGTTNLNITNFAENGTKAADFPITVKDNLGAVVSTNSFSIGAGLSYTVAVQFDPSLVGNENATITFNSNDAANAAVTLTANGTATASAFTTPHLVATPTALAVPTTPIGGLSNPQPITLANTGALPLTISSFTTVGVNKADFLVSVQDNNGNTINLNSGSFTIPVGRTYTIEVAFQPTVNGPENAGITFNTNDPLMNAVSLTESGVGTPPAAPNAPTGLTLTTISYHEIDLSFVDQSSDETGFHILRSTSATGTFTRIATLNANALIGNTVTYQDANLAPATTYYYEVTAFNDQGESTPALTGNAKTTTPSNNGSGNSPTSALVINAKSATVQGGMDGRRTYHDFVGTIDIRDYYRVRMTSRGNLSATLTPGHADADLEFYRYNLVTGKVVKLASSENSGTTPESTSVNVAAGYYLVEVVQGEAGANTDYTLTITSDYAGSDIAHALLLAPKFNKYDLRDYVGPDDTADLYKIVIRHKEVTIALTPFTADADLYLLDSKQRVVKKSEHSGTNQDAILISLKSGTYYIKVLPGDSSASTNYKLVVDTLEAPPT